MCFLASHPKIDAGLNDVHTPKGIEIKEVR